MLERVIGSDPWLYRQVLNCSAKVFATADRWLGLTTLTVLRTAATVAAPGVEIRPPESAEHPLGALLVQPHALEDGGVTDGLTSLVVVGIMTGRAEARLIADLSNGIRLSMRDRALAWKAVLPAPGSAPIDDMASWLKRCRGHAVAARTPRDARVTVQARWLDALAHWCDLLIADGDATDFLGLGSTVTVGLPTEGDVPENRQRDVTQLPVDDVDDGEVEGGDEDQRSLDGDLNEPGLAPHESPEAEEQATLSFPPHGAPDVNYPELPDEADVRAAKTGFKAARQSQWLPYLHEALSPEEASELTDWLRAELTSQARARRVAGGLIGLMAVTGLPLEIVLASPVADASPNSSFTTDGFWRKKILREPNAWKAQLTQLPLLRRWTNRVSFALPVDMRAWFQGATGGKAHQSLAHALHLDLAAAEQIVRESLELVRQKSAGHQTLGRVQHWLMTATYNVAQDHVAAHLVAATPNDPPQPAAYYRAYSTQQLAEFHRQALERAGWTFDAATADGNDREVWAGSQLNPEPDAIRQIWDDSRSAHIAIVNDEARPFHERFNSHQLLSAMQMAFLGGIRCVRDPIESIFDYSLDDRLGVVNDKCQSEERAHRLVALADVIVDQLRQQKEHLARTITRVRTVDARLAERIRLALRDPGSHTVPLFFLLDEQLRPRSIRPKDFKAALGKHWPLPLNLGRHFLATEFIQRGVGDLPTASFLGHVSVGTQNFSILSPLAPNQLYAGLTGVLNGIAEDLGLQALPSFLSEAPADLEKPLLSKGKRPGKLVFGTRARAAARSRFLNKVRLESAEWVATQLTTRAESELTQGDVDALFELARKASPNARTYAAVARFEYLRARLVSIVREHELDIDLPAIAVPIHDHAIVCPRDAPQAAAWLRVVRHELRKRWTSAFDVWRRSRGERQEHDLALVALTVIVECAAIDPAIWPGRDGAETEPRTRDEPLLIRSDGNHYLRFDVGGDNSRLYPVPRLLALVLGQMALRDLIACDQDAVVDLARELSADSPTAAPTDLRSLLAIVDTGMSLHAPGLILGYADGGHASVSPPDTCLERIGGRMPRAESLARFRARGDEGRRSRQAALAQALRDAEAEIDRQGLLDKCVADVDGSAPDVGRFIRAVSKAFKVGTRVARRKGSDTTASDELVDRPQGDHEGTLRKRFVATLESEFESLAATGAQLPATCVQVGDWLFGLANSGYGSGQYVMKTLRNLWYSWGRLLAREAASYRLESLEAAELTAIYIDAVAESKASKRAHIYPLIRNFHRFLMDHHGACGIDWTTVARACGAGAARVDVNVVHEAEYLEALRMLYEDKHAADKRLAAANATCLVLMYRGGLRIDEVTGLRSVDLQLRSSRWFIRIGKNVYRGIKSDAGVRRVPILETLTEFESQVLSDWRAHIDGFLDHRAHYPLFTTEQNSVVRISLREVSQRINQALRSATGDPLVRGHHCRHAWATRMLKLLLGDPAAETQDPKGAVVEAAEDRSGVIRAFLTGSKDRTRRVLWAIAEVLGHGSPMQTMHSYAHCGHELLAQWLTRKWWHEQPILALPSTSTEVDLELFACGVMRRSWVRRSERAAHSKKAPPAFDADAAMVSLVDLDRGPRVSVGPGLGPTRRLASGRAPRLFDIDRLVDHARQFGHVRGLDEALFVSRAWTDSVLEHARAVCADSRGPSLNEAESHWWLDKSDTRYSANERRQLRAAYRRLEKVSLAGRGKTIEALVELFDYPSAMFVVSNAGQVREVVKLLDVITGTRDAIELLIPATKPAAPTTGRGKKRRSMKGVKKPRVASYVAQFGNAVWAPWRSLADQLKVEHTLHGDVPERRDGGRNSFERGLRVGVRVKENSTWTVRSAKVGARVFATWAIGARMAT